MLKNIEANNTHTDTKRTETHDKQAKRNKHFGHQLCKNSKYSTVQQILKQYNTVTQNIHEISAEDLTPFLTNPTEIKNTIEHLPNNKGAGPDDKIPNLVLKRVLVHITNMINAPLPDYQKMPQSFRYKKNKDQHDLLNLATCLSKYKRIVFCHQFIVKSQIIL